jgi:DNA repair protein RecO (recombination protein O)
MPFRARRLFERSIFIIVKIYQTEGIFLHNHVLSEADKIVACLTKDFGLIRLVAKGARKLKSRFSAGIEPFSVGEISFYQREDADLGILRGVELKQTYFHLAKNLNSLHAFSYFAELLLQFAPPHEQNFSLYRMVQACFAALSEAVGDAGKTAAAVFYFESWLLRLNGFLPDIRHCAECRRLNDGSQPVVWTVDNRLVCQVCGNNRGIVFERSQVQILKRVRRLSPAEFTDFAAAHTADLKLLQNLNRKLIRQVVARDFEYWSEKNWELI